MITLTMSPGAVLLTAAFAAWLIWIFQDEDEDEIEEEPVVAKVIIPALPGYYVIEFDTDKMKAAKTVDDILRILVQWPVIAWEVAESADYEPPMAITTAGIENKFVVLLWPNGAVHEQDGETYGGLGYYAEHLLRLRAESAD
jgi:hypothetical protein